jgi:hypothetical protein
MDERRDTRFEPDRVEVRGIAVGFAIIVAGIAVAVAVSWLLSAWTGNRNGPNAAHLAAPAAPALQPAPLDDRAKFEKEKSDRLQGYGWLEDAPGRAHIPIDVAMRMLSKEQP